MAQLAVAAAGAAVGSLFGAPQVGWLVGSFIGGQLFGGQGGKVEGPRLGDLQVQASTYGMGLSPTIHGSMRIAGNVIWAKPLIEKRQKESAGKGGGGQTVVSYSYYATFCRRVCPRPDRCDPKGLGQHNSRHQITDVDTTKTSFTTIPPPRKQQRGGIPMATRRRRHLPMAMMALLDDPKLLLKAPTTPTAGVDHFETANLRTIRMPSHKDSQQQMTRERCAGKLVTASDQAAA